MKFFLLILTLFVIINFVCGSPDNNDENISKVHLKNVVAGQRMPSSANINNNAMLKFLRRKRGEPTAKALPAVSHEIPEEEILESYSGKHPPLQGGKVKPLDFDAVVAVPFDSTDIS